MFNGLIRDYGIVKSYSNNVLSIKSNLKPKIGDSIAINGACLSAISLENDGFSVELSSESAKILKPFRVNDKVHLEPALRLSDRIDGHLIQGHIDCVGKISKIEKLAVGTDFYIQTNSSALMYIASKGSVAIDGVSLTVNDVFNDGFRLTIIPITLKDTLFNSYKVGDFVNIETDLLARYAKRILDYKHTNNLTWDEVDKINALY